MEAYLQYKVGEARLIKEERCNAADDFQRSVRGKSANQIKRILLNESMGRRQEAIDQKARDSRERYVMSQHRSARSLSETCLRNCEQSHQNIVNTMGNLKEELSDFTNRTQEFFTDNR